MLWHVVNLTGNWKRLNSLFRRDFCDGVSDKLQEKLDYFCYYTSFVFFLLFSLF